MMDPMTEIKKFQTLIGTVKSDIRNIDLSSVNLGFQTLIGTVKRDTPFEGLPVAAAFQTLIGTVKSGSAGTSCAGERVVSNPHRYGQKVVEAHKSPPVLAGFKPS